NLFVVYSAAASKIRELGAAIGALGVKRNTVMSSDVLPALLQELGGCQRTSCAKAESRGRPCTRRLACAVAIRFA
ncbi:hypothetical protein, partial [Burkholderia ubonensis]|uniref:hypothetical protein n=1 Tax=Burkholderia ubonensis TaxID=101571 RepID=UPI001E6290D9